MKIVTDILYHFHTEFHVILTAFLNIVKNFKLIEMLPKDCRDFPHAFHFTFSNVNILHIQSTIFESKY